MRKVPVEKSQGFTGNTEKRKRAKDMTFGKGMGGSKVEGRQSLSIP